MIKQIKVSVVVFLFFFSGNVIGKTVDFRGFKIGESLQKISERLIKKGLCIEGIKRVKKDWKTQFKSVYIQCKFLFGGFYKKTFFQGSDTKSFSASKLVQITVEIEAKTPVEAGKKWKKWNILLKRKYGQATTTPSKINYKNYNDGLTSNIAQAYNADQVLLAREGKKKIYIIYSTKELSNKMLAPQKREKNGITLKEF
jgi:hypothetical protein